MSLISIIFHGNLLRQIGGRKEEKKREKGEKERKIRKEYKFSLFL